MATVSPEAEAALADDASAHAPSDEATLVMHPPPGEWTIAMWAALDTREMPCELVDGCLEFLPVPRNRHHFITAAVSHLLRGRFGFLRIFENGIKVRVFERTGRIPDVIVLDRPLAGDDMEDEFLDASRVALAVEVVSPGRRQRDRDYRDKRADYAAAGIAEYWIIDPETRLVLTLVLDGDSYRETEPVGIDGKIATPSMGEPIAVADLFPTDAGAGD